MTKACDALLRHERPRAVVSGGGDEPGCRGFCTTHREIFAISRWTQVEFGSVLAKQVRMGLLFPETAVAVMAEFDLSIARSFVVLLPDAEDYDLAVQYLRYDGLGLRAGDALHLAVARNNSVEVIYSFDKVMIKAGMALGLPLSTGIDVT